MKHEITIVHDLKFFARPFGVSCSCGFKAAAETYKEAERIVKNHQEYEASKNKIMSPEPPKC